MTLTEIQQQINSSIYQNGQRLISGSTLNTILQSLALYTSQVDAKVITGILPFGGVLDGNVILSTYQITPLHIYYSTSLDMFIASRGDERSTAFSTSIQYNVSGSADKTKIYIDTDGSIYAFISGVLTKIVDLNKGFTTLSTTNLAIKELYVERLNSTNVAYLIGEINKGESYKVTLLGANNAVVATYESTTQSSLIKLTGATVNAYMVIDWGAVKEGWFNYEYDGVSYLTERTEDIENSPTIYSYINSVKFINETEVEI